MRYFITFACYGSHVHGAQPGSVDRNHNLAGSRTLEIDRNRAELENAAMKQGPYLLDERARPVVLHAIQEVCAHRGWNLLAAHVRSNHVHVVVEAEAKPEKIMNDLKSYASRALNIVEADKSRRRWAHHGSTQWLWTDQDAREAIRYVIDDQGEPMALFVAEMF
jgi:REP element-mobilizing transposase RayT